MQTYTSRQDFGRPWRIWDLDAEMRYWPVLEALPRHGVVCEIGSGAAGLASWTDREIIGIDPGADDRHGEFAPLPNLRRVDGDGASIPLGDQTVMATVAVDTFEHIPLAQRPAVIEEMVRVTASGGRVIIMGPVGPDAASGDRWLLDMLNRSGNPPEWAFWLKEHLEFGVPTLQELDRQVRHARICRVQRAGYLNIDLWRGMHLAAQARFGRPDRSLWKVYARFARRYRRGPYYRWMYVADVR